MHVHDQAIEQLEKEPVPFVLFVQSGDDVLQYAVVTPDVSTVAFLEEIKKSVEVALARELGQLP
jgi:hypothetical protein